jgi:hypothetical protein
MWRGALALGRKRSYPSQKKQANPIPVKVVQKFKLLKCIFED